MAYYVCSDAKLKCSMGFQESALTVIHPVRPARVQGNPIAAMMDYKPFLNISPFGQCQSLANPIVAAATAANYGKLQPMPCVPNTTTPWMGAKMNVRIKGNPALLDTSKLMCMWAGVIEITNSGQRLMKEGSTPLNYKIGSIKSEEKAKDVEVDVDNVEDNEDEVAKLTVKDFAEILERIERKKSCYESARYYATYHVDYWTLTKLARRYVDETDEEKKEKEKDNDPNLMPSRFMLLYGADDDKLRQHGNLDLHHDDFANPAEHEVSVANLRKALILLGHDIEDTGPFDEPLFIAFLRYLSRFGRIEQKHLYEDEADAEKPLEEISDKYGLAAWKCFYDEECSDGDGSINHEKIMKKLNSNYGDGLIMEKGGIPHDYRSSICYCYPWVPFSLTAKIVDDYQVKEDATYKIYDRALGTLLGEGPFRKPYIIECLLPDSQDVMVIANGSEIFSNLEYPVAHLSSEEDEEEDTEPRVTKIYWAYWNGEKYVELEENKKTRHYADLSLIVETENYNDGDTVEVTIESDGEEQLFDGEPVLKLNGIVFDNRIVFEGIFNKYTLN